MIARYLGRVSDPLLERIDIQHAMSSVEFGEMVSVVAAEDSATVRGRVLVAWERQQHRFEGHGRVLNNAQMSVGDIREHCRLRREALGFLRVAMTKLQLRPRAFHRVLRLSRTIGDLAGRERIGEEDVAEAIAYRVLDRGSGG
jgi:magnesium chelatase family protein